jgi:hypothetical protein
MNALVREIVKLSEHSFRRGYQHGHAAGIGEFGPPPTGKAVHDWRFARNADFAAVGGPHEKRKAYRRWPAIERVRAEINMTEYPHLFALLSNSVIDMTSSGITPTSPNAGGERTACPKGTNDHT